MRQCSRKVEVAAAKPSLTPANETSKTGQYSPQAPSADRQEAHRPSTLPAADFLLGTGAAFTDIETPIEGDCGSLLTENIDSYWWTEDEDDDRLDRFFRSQREELVPRLMRTAHVDELEEGEVFQELNKVSHYS